MKYKMKSINFILEKIKEKLFDSLVTTNQISGKINLQFVLDGWQEANCMTVMNCFAYCGFSNLNDLQPDPTPELNEHFLPVENH